MTEEEIERAWNAELDTVRTVVRARLGPDASARDVEQASTAVLLACTLGDEAFRTVLYFVDMERDKRGGSLAETAQAVAERPQRKGNRASRRAKPRGQ